MEKTQWCSGGGGGGGGLRGAEPPLLKFHVDLGGGGLSPPIFFARCILILTTSKTHTKISVNENVL